MKNSILLCLIILLIAPVCTFSQLVWSTYFGGDNYDNLGGLKVDNIGNVYTSGSTYSNNFPMTSGAYNRNYTSNNGDSSNIFISKFDSNCSNLIYSTYIGLGWNYSLDIDKFGNSYITGSTRNDYPTTAGAFDTSHSKGEKIIITKLNSTGNALLYSIFLGVGDIYNRGMKIKVDSIGEIYVTGFTTSSKFPTTTEAYDTSFNGFSYRNPSGDVFFTKMNPTFDSLIYSTYIGGSDNEIGYDFVIDNAENAYITGTTQSNDFPITIGAFDTIYNTSWYNGFVTKLNVKGNNLIYSTYLGGSHFGNTKFVLINSIAINKYYDAYITGTTNSDDYPVSPNAYSRKLNGIGDIICTKLNPTGDSLIFSTFIGGSDGDGGEGMVLDNEYNVYIVGSTHSNDFPTTCNAFDKTYHGIIDCILTKLSNDGSSLIYSTILGGAKNDYGLLINIDSLNNIYLAGQTLSVDFPTTINAYKRKFNYSIDPLDIFITKFTQPGGSATLQSGNISGCPGDTVDLPIYLKNTNCINQSGATGFTADLNFNSSLLLPLLEPKGTVTNGKRTIPLNLPIHSDTNQILTKMKFIVGLGNDTISTLTLSNLASIGGNVNIDTLNGLFKLECVCHEGGPRLINIDGALSLTCKPNPINDKVQFDFETIEDGYTELYVTDMLGNKLMKVFESETHGKYSIEADMSLFYSGVYAYTLQTPTKRVSKLFVIEN
jgi:hypothetical protein